MLLNRQQAKVFYEYNFGRMMNENDESATIITLNT